MILYSNQKSYTEQAFSLEADLERELVSHAKLIFGEASIYIDAKRKIEAQALGGTIPDGFLFDLSDPDDAEFYLVEVELATHDFFRHIFPQVTKFFAFFKNTNSRTNLIEKIYSIVNADPSLRAEFAKHLGTRELYKFIKDTIENSQNILLVLDEQKKELPEIMDTYADTWGKLVKLMTFKKFVNAGDVILACQPEFERIEIPETAEGGDEDQEESVTYSEEYHLDGVSDLVKVVYHKLKDHVLRINSSLRFNPQKYYISIKDRRNLAFFMFRKKKLHLTVPLREEQARKHVKRHTVKSLSESVQRFWGGGHPWCRITIASDDNLAEVVEVLHAVLPKNS